MKRKVLLLTICLLITHIMGVKAQTGTTFTAQTTEGWDMVFTVLDEDAKTCQVGYLDGSSGVAINWAVEGNVTIPGVVNGYTVVKIGRSSFENIQGMTSVVIPETVTFIDFAAFSSCIRLKAINLPASVSYIGEFALWGLSDLRTIVVAEGNTKYDSRNGCNAIIETETNYYLAVKRPKSLQV